MIGVAGIEIKIRTVPRTSRRIDQTPWHKQLRDTVVLPFTLLRYLLDKCIEYLDEAYLPDELVKIISFVMSAVYLLMTRVASQHAISPELENKIVWILPLLSSTLSFTMCLTMILQSAPRDMAALGFSALLMIEGLLPLVLAVVAGLSPTLNNITSQIIWISIIAVWFASKLTACLIRRMIYPELGHG